MQEERKRGTSGDPRGEEKSAEKIGCSEERLNNGESDKSPQQWRAAFTRNQWQDRAPRRCCTSGDESFTQIMRKDLLTKRKK